MRAIAQHARPPLQMVFGEGAKGKQINFSATDVTPEQAIDMVAAGSGLKWKKSEDGVFHIDGPATPPANEQVRQEAPAPVAGKGVWEGLTLSLRFAHTQGESAAFEAERPIGIHVSIKNISGQEKVVPTSDILNVAASIGQAVLIVKDDKGEMIPLTRFGKSYQKRAGIVTDPIMIAPFTLKPGEEARNSIALNRIFDMTQSGTYTFSVKYAAPLYFGTRRDMPKGVFVDPPAEIEPNLRKIPAPDIGDDMPNPLRRNKENEMVMILAPEDSADVPHLVSNTLKIEVANTATEWIYKGKPRPTP
jgi:hypothetical protein